MTEGRLLEVSGAYVRWFLNGRIKPWKEYPVKDDSMEVTKNILIGICSYLFVLISVGYLLILIAT